MDAFEKMMAEISAELEKAKKPEEVKPNDFLAEVKEDLEFLDVENNPESLAQDIADYVSGKDKRGLYFVGNIGTGKTVRAKALAMILGCRYFTAMQLCELFVNDRTSYDELFVPQNCVGVPYYNDIVIDDMGTELPTYQVYGTKYDVMADFLQRRYDQWPNYATHVTTNLNRTELVKRYGERIHSRICEMMKAIKIVGDDRRKKK